MTKRGIWPVRAMYMLVAVALAISLIITAAPSPTVLAATASNVTAEWDRIDTPTMDGFVVAPESTIIDYALASQGEVAYAVVRAYDEDWDDYGYRLLKSTDHAATWTDITDALENVIDVDDGDYIDVLVQVATDWEDPDFVAVALWWWDESAGSYYLHVFISDDGGATFVDADEVEDGGWYLDRVSDLAVSYENADGKREIAIGGIAYDGFTYDSGLFRCTVTGDSPGAWKDATEDNGWDDDGVDFTSYLVTDIIFSPSWATDKTILVTTVAPDITFDTVYLQAGTWGTSPGWNEFSTLGIPAVPVKEDVRLEIGLMIWDARAIAGMTLPEDYNSKSTDTRLLWVWVNYYDADDGDAPACEIMRVDNDDAHPVGPLGQVLEGTVWLTNVSYKGTIESGEAIAGLLGYGTYVMSIDELLTARCEGVQVYHNDGITNMDICCERWKKACKPPTGNAAMAVSYVGENKAYAVALHSFGYSDEGAWSMTFDDGYNWNQLSLIDTYISYLSDVAVSPDCNKTMLVSVNEDWWEGEEPIELFCDSVWLHAVNLPEAPEYSGQWLRTWSGMLTGNNSIDFPDFPEHGFLRLAPEETNGDTVFLVDRMSGYVYWSCLETLDCWAIIASTTVEAIVDLAPQDADTLYALDADGDVAMFDEDEWDLAVASGVDDGWTIAVWGDDILVGGQDGDVAHSADGGETFTDLEDVAVNGVVTVAFDSYFGENGTIYAALAWSDDNGIYLWVIGESTTWTNLGADPYDYTGLVLDNADGNPETSPTTGGVLYASYVGTRVVDVGGQMREYWTGVARTLTPIVDIECVACTEWDYLVLGLGYSEMEANMEWFYAMPDALKICGCLTPDSHSRLFAIDWYDGYDMADGEYGNVWRFIDCYSKSGPDLNAPDDGYLAGADACDCINAPFTVSWDRLCDACFYEIQIASDPDFDNIYWTNLSVLGNPVESPSYLIPRELLPGETYYWRVRSIIANTGQIIRSWWSEERSLTVAPSLGTGAYVVAPEIGATGMPNTNIAFLWGSVAVFDSYNWVLSPNADFSSPVETKTGLTSPAYTYTGTALAYDTPYYWRVTAIKDGAPASLAIGTFRTVVEPEEVIPPVTPTTPFWVWVVIAIGAVLVIVVIVLIFRTRRV